MCGDGAGSSSATATSHFETLLPAMLCKAVRPRAWLCGHTEPSGPQDAVWQLLSSSWSWRPSRSLVDGYE